MVWEVKDIGAKSAESSKKVKKTGKQKKPAISADEEAWNKLSMEAPPPMPETIDLPVAGTKKRKRIKANVETIHDLDWSEVEQSSSALLTDDAGGFVCLEELSDIDVEYEGDDSTGKIIKFKKITPTKNAKGQKKDKKHRPANPEKPLTIEETKQYYDLDTFNEELAAKQVDELTESQAVIGDDMQLDEPVATNEEELEESPDMEQDSEITSDVNLTAKEKKLQKKQEKLAKLKEKKKAAKLAAKEATLVAEEEEQTDSKKKRPSVADVDQEFDTSKWDAFNLNEAIISALKHHKFSSPTPIQEKTLPLASEGRDIIGAAETGSGKTLAFGIPIAQYLANLGNDENQHSMAALILTPTRELAMQVKNHIENITCFMDIRTIAIVGGMSVQKQKRQLGQKPNIVVATPGRLWELFSEDDVHLESLKHLKFLVLDEADRMIEGGHFQELDEILKAISQGNSKPDDTENTLKRQTLVFTATLSNALRFDRRKKKSKKSKSPSSEGTMDDIIQRLELNDKDPAIVDITTTSAVASRLVEAKIDCLQKEKDLFLYYFVTRYPGRTIVFVNSIDAIRRLVPISKLLGLEVIGLHAQMQQKQRLKNLDRFKANKTAVLVASDVAARGLDIPLVDHVIHYQLPRSGEIYVHRSGRTARANQDGVSLMLCSPEEVSLYKKLVLTLRNGEPYPDFPVDYSIQREMKKQVELATKIDKEEHRLQKINHDDDWMKRMAGELDIEYDEDEHSVKKKKRKNTDDEEEEAKIQAKVRSWKAELKHMCAQPLLPHGASQKYITGSTMQDLVERLLNSEKNERLPASIVTKAIDDVKEKAKTNQRRRLAKK
ncbi:ATP-dependent RNA helicase [Umbelopsis sp. WA50703]